MKSVTFDRLSSSLYLVLLNGRETNLSVEFDGGEFCCYSRDLLGIRTRTLEEMRDFLTLELEG